MTPHPNPFPIEVGYIRLRQFKSPTRVNPSWVGEGAHRHWRKFSIFSNSKKQGSVETVIAGVPGVRPLHAAGHKVVQQQPVRFAGRAAALQGEIEELRSPFEAAIAAGKHVIGVDLLRAQIDRQPAGAAGNRAPGIPGDSSEPKGQELNYSARISLDRTNMRIDDKMVNLSPGMAVTVEIKTGSREILSYLLSPLLRYRQETLRER